MTGGFKYDLKQKQTHIESPEISFLNYQKGWFPDFFCLSFYLLSGFHQRRGCNFTISPNSGMMTGIPRFLASAANT